MRARPFMDNREVMEIASSTWMDLERTDWLQAFAAHPRIGDREVADSWSRQEQAGMRRANAHTEKEIAELNCAYEREFGHVFLVCASGLEADAMLEALRERIRNDPETELLNAAREQEKITRLRLARLVDR